MKKKNIKFNTDFQQILFLQRQPFSARNKHEFKIIFYIGDVMKKKKLIPKNVKKKLAEIFFLKNKLYKKDLNTMREK